MKRNGNRPTVSRVRDVRVCQFLLEGTVFEDITYDGGTTLELLRHNTHFYRSKLMQLPKVLLFTYVGGSVYVQSFSRTLLLQLPKHMEFQYRYASAFLSCPP